ncbi:MAG: twin-arginine translocation signal domain-containing protein, partial [Dechloromonas sp.]|nr:twin-arginine translocation signal domain-containing protein [Dechloromonas sp.]
MLIRHPHDLPPSDITDPAHYATRRKFIQTLLLAGGAGALGMAHGISSDSAPGVSLGKLQSSPLSL